MCAVIENQCVSAVNMETLPHTFSTLSIYKQLSEQVKPTEFKKRKDTKNKLKIRNNKEINNNKHSYFHRCFGVLIVNKKHLSDKLYGNHDDATSLTVINYDNGNYTIITSTTATII